MMCQANSTAGCEDGVAPDGALHPGEGGEAEEIIVLRRRIAILTDKWEKGYSQGFGDGYRQAEYDCEAMGQEAFLKARSKGASNVR